jgi:hypothetical protein
VAVELSPTVGVEVAVAGGAPLAMSHALTVLEFASMPAAQALLSHPPPLTTVATYVSEYCPPGLSAPSAQLIVRLLESYVPPLSALTKSRPAGTWSPTWVSIN